MQIINGVRKKQPGRVVVAPGAKLLVSREERRPSSVPSVSVDSITS